MQHLLPPYFSQFNIDGRDGSNACTVIATMAAASLILGNIVFPVPGEQPSPSSVQQLITDMQVGKNLYEQAFPDSRPLLGVYDAFDLITLVSCRRNWDLGIRSSGHCRQQLQAIYEKCQEEQSVLAGILVQNPLSVAVGISPSGHAAVLDSHSHRRYGASMAFSHQPADWLGFTGFLKTLVGTHRDAHLCLITVR